MSGDAVVTDISSEPGRPGREAAAGPAEPRPHWQADQTPARRLVPLLISGLLCGALLFGFAPYALITGSLWEDAPVDWWVVHFASVVLAVASVVVGIRWCVLFVLAFASRRRDEQHPPREPAKWPFVSVFVPAFNEGETIKPALESLLALDYPRFEVLVVDDGSSDDTLRHARRFEGDHGHCLIRVFHKTNGGKWSAHNFAFQHARGELILCLDADSQLEPMALRRMVARMAGPSLDGVSGQIRVRNRDRLLTRLQGLEYVMANGALRTAQGLTGSVLIVPGPIGMFRRSAMEEVYLRYGDLPAPEPGEVPGPFEGDTFAEDFDLSLAVLALGGRIDYEPTAVSHTQAPDATLVLINQRYRWCRGMMQVLRKYLRRAAADPSLRRGRVLGWIGVTYLLDLMVLPVVYLVILSGTLAYLGAGGPAVPLLAWMGAFVVLNLNAATMFVVMHNDRLTLLRVLPVYDLYQGLMLNAAWMISVLDELRNTRMRWS